MKYVAAWHEHSLGTNRNTITTDGTRRCFHISSICLFAMLSFNLDNREFYDGVLLGPFLSCPCLSLLLAYPTDHFEEIFLPAMPRGEIRVEIRHKLVW